jgi:hypothetical protein
MTCQLTESISLKLVSSPLTGHTTCLCSLLGALLSHTDADYHLQLIKELVLMMEALYKELKKGSQEPFKKKILFKLNYSIGLICLQGTVSQWFLHKYMELLKSDKCELGYLLLTAVDAEWLARDGKEIASQIVD